MYSVDELEVVTEYVEQIPGARIWVPDGGSADLTERVLPERQHQNCPVAVCFQPFVGSTVFAAS